MLFSCPSLSISMYNVHVKRTVSHHLSFRAVDACAFGQRDNLQLPQTSKLYDIRQPVTSLCTTSNFLVYNLQLLHITSNSKCTTSNFLVYNLQLPHITSNFLRVAMVIMVATVTVVMVVMVVRTG